MKIYNCKKVLLQTPKFITYNSEPERHKKVVSIDICISNEIKDLWNRGIKTTGCCCGHGRKLGFIEVDDKNIKDMEELKIWKNWGIHITYMMKNLEAWREKMHLFQNHMVMIITDIVMDFLG